MPAGFDPLCRCRGQLLGGYSIYASGSAAAVTSYTYTTDPQSCNTSDGYLPKVYIGCNCSHICSAASVTVLQIDQEPCLVPRVCNAAQSHILGMLQRAMDQEHCEGPRIRGYGILCRATDQEHCVGPQIWNIDQSHGLGTLCRATDMEYCVEPRNRNIVQSHGFATLLQTTDQERCIEPWIRNTAQGHIFGMLRRAMDQECGIGPLIWNAAQSHGLGTL